ncbi:DnaD domain protein [Niallia circulans]|nr:DnaD domain protein [Niallia circulans]QJX63069.1 DnaD domain protein [Niallia circulans]
MADVQLEHGFTKIANELLEHMATIKLSPIQYRLIFVIWRYTYGFNRKEHTLSQSFLSTATGYDDRQIRRELQKLEQRKIIYQKISNGRSRVIGFNKNYDKWTDEEREGKTPPGRITPGKTTLPTPGKVTPGTPGNSTPQEINNLNKNLNKNKEDEENTLNRILELLEKSKIINPEDITEFLCEDINDVINNFGFEEPELLIEEAIKDSARGNGKTWKFVYNKLFDWKKQGIKTVSDLESEGSSNGRSKKYRSGNGRAPKKSSESITGNQVGWIGKRD